MENTNSDHISRRNKNAVIRRKSDISKTTCNLTTKENVPDREERKAVTTDCIEIDVGDEDSDTLSAILSLGNVVEVFNEGVTVYDCGKIAVYFNPWDNFRYDIEHTAHEKQRDISYLDEVYSTHNAFLLYRSKHGNGLILPESSDFRTVFERLRNRRKKNQNLASNVSVRLKDINLKESRRKHAKHNQEYHHVYYSFDSKFPYQERKVDDDTTKILESVTDFEDKNIIPLSNTRDNINSKLQKVKTPHTQDVPSLQWIPPSLSIERVILQYPIREGQLQYPMQVSAEQRDDYLAHSEQVVSDTHSTTYHTGNILYGLRETQTHHNAHAPLASIAPSHQIDPGRELQNRPRVPPRYPNYSDYANRIVSFRTWVHSSPDAARLSQAGFFFTDEGDLVRCFQCGIGLKDFTSDDDPLLEHVRHSGKCPFLPALLGVDTLAIYKNRLQAEDPEYNRRQQWANIQNGSAPNTSHKHPQYQTLQARISTFSGWPQSMSQTPRQLAEAGLFYTGTEDQVRCFACDGGLRRWDPEDDPWTEHCRWFPACPFALEQKGQQYIALIQASVENERYGASGGGEQDLTNAMEQLNLKESMIETVLKQHKDVCLEMGYEEMDIKAAVQELIERGKDQQSLEDIIVLIDVIRERNKTSVQSAANESPFDENKRLKRIVYCMMCGKNNVNALFLPCTHHELCMSCADPLETCPVCHRGIREKIRTYMA